MVPWTHPSPQPTRHLDWLSHFAGLTIATDRQTNRQTDHAVPPVAIIGRIYVVLQFRLKTKNAISRQWFNHLSQKFGTMTRRPSGLLTVKISPFYKSFLYSISMDLNEIRQDDAQFDSEHHRLLKI